MKNTSLVMKFTKYEVALQNALNNSIILEGLSEYGYDELKLKEGKELLDKTKNTYDLQKNEHAEKTDSTKTLKEDQKRVHKHYMKTVKIAKIAYKKDEISLEKLTLNQPREKNLYEWLDQSERFYNNLIGWINSSDPEEKKLFEPMKRFKYTEEKLKNELKMVQDIKELHMNQKQDSGEAKSATRQKDETLEELDDWMSDYFKVAKIVFEDQKEYLIILGIVSNEGKKNKKSEETSQNDGTAQE